METITINNVKYLLDVQKAMEIGILKQQFNTKRIGEHYEEGQDIYVLAGTKFSSDERYCQLINIKTGARFTDPILVNDFSGINEEEWKRISADYYLKKVEIQIISKT